MPLAVLTAGFALLLGAQGPSDTFDELPSPEMDQVRKALGVEPNRVWLEDDVLHIYAKSEEQKLFLTGGLQRPMTRIGSSEFWALRLRRADWRKGMLSYAFHGDRMDGIKFTEWRGPDAPPAPVIGKTAARVEELTIESVHLGEARKVTVVLPAGDHKNLPAVVLADGQSAASVGTWMQGLVETGRTRPFAIIGIHNGGYRGKPGEPFDPKNDFRALEYLETATDSRFASHLKFVLEEVLPMVRQKFGLSTKREDLVVTGFSNGGAFAASAGVQAPEVFGTSIPMSLGVPPTKPRSTSSLPKFIFVAGELEPRFLAQTKIAYQSSQEWGAMSTLKTYVAGHDSMMWGTAFAEILPTVFPPPKAGQGNSPDPIRAK